MVYINGIKASKGDIATLTQWVKLGKTTVHIHITKKGAIAITTTA